MSFGKNALMASFAFIGFLAGTALYAVFNWIVVNSTAAGILYIPVPIFAPWFMSGLGGAFMSVILVLVVSHFSREH